VKSWLSTLTLAGTTALGTVFLVTGSDEPGKPEAVSNTPAAVFAPIAPTLSQDLVLELQEGKWDAALERLAKLIGDDKLPAEDRTYFRLLRATALRLANRLDAAREELAATVREAPGGQSAWLAKLRSEQMAVDLAASRFPDAEKVARAEVERLLGPGRKDGLAGVYLDYARKLLNPTEPTAQADPEAAYALLSQGLQLAQSAQTKASIQLMLGEASQKAGNHARALGDFQTYLSTYKDGADRSRARYLLGESQLLAGQALPARLTWTDLVRELDRSDKPEEIDLRVKAQYGIARTYAMPQPGDDNALALGTAALKKLLERNPAHPLAVNAAYEIAAGAIHRGKTQQAIEALQAFIERKNHEATTDDAKRRQADLIMTATFQVGQVLQSQAKFDEAINAFKTYLSRFPDGPQSADAQRQILETQLMIAAEHLRHERYDEARAAWQAFATANPLDGRVPQLLFQIGESFVPQQKYDEAIAAWEMLAGKFPNTEPAAHGLFLIASLFEVQKGNPAEAIERFKKVNVDPWQSSAHQRIAAMEAKNLIVVTPRAFRTGETPHLEITSRNLERLTFTAYKLDPEAYYRKKQNLVGVEHLDIGLVSADAEWTTPVPGYAKYKPVESKYELPKLESPGVYVVKVTDERNLQATTLVVASDIEAVVKASRDQLLVFFQDMKTGKGRANVRVLVTEPGGGFVEVKTGADGVVLHPWSKPRDPGQGLHYLIVDGGHVAGSGLALSDRVAQGMSPRAYLATDRPAYRPGQSVALRGVLREIEEGRYANRPGGDYRLELTDSRGRLFLAKNVKLSEFGTFHETFSLDSGAPVGTYRIRVFQPGKSEFAGSFEVQAYQLQKIDLAVELPRPVYFRGEKIEGKVVAKYQYGTPLAGRSVVVALPDGRTLTGTTDAAGTYAFTLETEGFGEEQILAIQAQLPEENVAAVGAAALAVKAFRIELATSRDVFLDGESFPLSVKSIDATGKPTGEEIKISILKLVEQAGQIAEREVATQSVKTDPKTGSGSTPVKIADSKGGKYILRASGTDRFGNPILADRALVISGSEDTERLRILADRTNYKVGETARVSLLSRDSSGPALLAWEADRILEYRILDLKEGENALEWPVEGDQFPNFTLTATRMAGTKLRKAALDLAISRELAVTVRPVKETVTPGEEFELTVETRDQLGNPVAAEVAIALVDEALLRLFADHLPPIDRFFYDQTRTGAFSTEATNTFRYAPATESVAEAVAEELERQLAQAGDEAARIRVHEQALLGLARADSPAEAGATAGQVVAQSGAAPRDSRMMGGMGGMAGGRGGAAGGGMAGRPASATANTPAPPRMMGDQLEALDAASSDEKSQVRARRAFAVQEFRKQLAEGEQAGVNFDYANGAVAFGVAMASKDAEPAREQFVETAYWNPSVVTGKDGNAQIKIKAPLALSRYRFTARGVTGADTLVGQTTAPLAVNKDFFVELKLPGYLIEGDKPRVLARVHHRGVKAPGELKLTVYASGKEETYPRKLDWKEDGVEEILLEGFDVPAAEEARFTATATAENARDQVVVEIPVRPWGVQAIASASGSTSSDTSVFVSLPPGRAYTSPEMLLVLSPTLDRMVIELALGRDAYVLDERFRTCILPPGPNTIADRAGELLASAAAMQYLQAVRAPAAPDAKRLLDRARGLVAELITLQNEDGGWPWVISGQQEKRGSHLLTSARVVWALTEAERLSIPLDGQVMEKAAGFLTAQWAQVDSGDPETRAAVLQALATRGRATFEQANSLNRLRANLSDAALAYLALTFSALERPALANEVLGILTPRAKTEIPAPGAKPRYYWDGRSTHPWHRNAIETTSLAALAYATAQPAAPQLEGAVEWILARRFGEGWRPSKAKGPALAVLSRFYGKAQPATDRYRLVVTVNDEKVLETEVDGPTTGQAIRVPVKALKTTGENRVALDLEGRGRLGYSVTLTGFTREFGPDQNRANRPFGVHRRVYWAPTPTLENKPLPTGFSVANNAQTWENTITQLGLGGRSTISIEAWRNQHPGQPAWEQDMLVIEEHVPAGLSLVPDSVQTQGAHHEFVDGVLRVYFTADQYPGLTYEVYGYLPGDYRALPPRIQSVYEPGRLHLGAEGGLKILAPGEKSTDPYKPTPDELYARGKALYDSGRYAESGPHLEALWSAYSLRDDVAKDAARMLLAIHIRDYDPRKVVAYFEVLKEKAPELYIPFEDIKVVGRAYADIGEFERAYLVWRATAEASYLEDAKVGETLRQRGQTLEGLAFLLKLWREYPSTAAIDSDFYGLSQAIGGLAGQAITNPTVRRELAAAQVTRSDLLGRSISLARAFLAANPRDPIADEASLAIITSYLELEDHNSVVALARRYAELYQKSRFLDSFQYSEALGRFHLGEYDRAIELAEKIAKATYKDAAGVDQPSPNKWEALYILGQIHDARRQPDKAIAYYRQVADRFGDAMGAVKELERKALGLPEVTVIRPKAQPAVAGVGLRNIAAQEPDQADKPRVKLDYRNVAAADVKVYPVDLLRLYLTRRNLDRITGIDLAGIKPLVETTLKLGSGADFENRIKDLDLPVAKEGAYLVMARGDELYASGILLISPIELEVLEEPEFGRVRVRVLDARTKAFLPKVSVKVIGSENPAFFSGETDLRGIFVAEGVRGQVTAVARAGKDQYAFHRGKTYVGQPPQPAQTPAAAPGAPESAPALQQQSLYENVRGLNESNRAIQLKRLEDRYKAEPGKGVQVDKAR
jgi:TolA-binding protein